MQVLREQFDKQNLHQVIANLPKQFTDAWQSTEASIDSQTQKIVFCGMGGSALPANLLKTYMAVNKAAFYIPIKINRDYTLPHIVDESWCGFFDSYSGNTEETLSALAEAEEKGMKQIVILAHGGKLKQIAEEKGYTYIEIPDYSQPRMAYGYIIGALLKLFQNSGLLNIDENEFSTDIDKVMESMADLEKNGYELAQRCQNKIPIIYSSNVWKYIAMVWKINFNENSKTQAFWNALPELNHNEMVGFTNLVADYKNIIIQDPNDHPRTIKRMQVLKSILGDKLNTEIITMPEGSPFFKMLVSLSIGLWTSYYLALINSIDPTPVDLVEQFKNLVKE
jgi:glucose/mannose-6-phosphate isomerase